MKHPPDTRRQLPSVDRLLSHDCLARPIALYGRKIVKRQVRTEIERIRSLMEAADSSGQTGLQEAIETLAERVAEQLTANLDRPLQRIINATGILVHTNLGRSPLPDQLARSLPAMLDASCSLEINMKTGERGDRGLRAAHLLTALTGAEDAIVANNNAAALLLILVGLAAGKEVIVSRGELVEIGGSFRIPDILNTSGARLIEVGTTNRTRLADYARAAGAETALLLKVHPSNYRISGFVESVAAAELVDLGRRCGVPVVVDEGSGLLRPHSAPQLAGSPSVEELITAGADLVCSSGDKLLGGPQAGLIMGSAELVRQLRNLPLYRALRTDRATFATLEGVLRMHLKGEELPLDRLWVDAVAHGERLAKVAERLGGTVVPAEAFLGGGSAPEMPIMGEAVSMPGDSKLLNRLRLGSPSVVGYLRKEHLILDLRTVDPKDDEGLIEAVQHAR
ncbi:MAG: L-seryl-tRNA(Sec) selenium transferase [Thermoanaerobaculia bacterium]